MTSLIIATARLMQGIQVLLCMLMIFYFFILFPHTLRFFESSCLCNKSTQSQIHHFQDIEIVSYEECIAYPACQPKTPLYYLKKFPMLPWFAMGLILLVTTTIAFLRMRNWARLVSQAFYLGLSAVLIVKCFAAYSSGYTLPGSNIITGAVVVYTIIFCLVFNNYDVEVLFK